MTKRTFSFRVDVTLDDYSLAGSEYDRIKFYLASTRGLKETIQSGIPMDDLEFREIDPLRATKIKVQRIK
jgi:hypothetical protein